MSISYKNNEMIFSSLNDLPVEIKGVCVWCRDKEEVQPFAIPDSTVHGISQARIMEWVVIPFSRESS